MDKVHDILISWLKGEIGSAKGERVLVATFYGFSSLGAFESPDFIERFHVEGSYIKVSSLKRSTRAEDEFARACTAAIHDLRNQGLLKTRTCPRDYEGGAVLFQLA